MKTTYFSVPDPCGESWNEMKPTKQGAFCDKCSKEVVDLTPIEPTAIKETLQKKKNPCIRILQRQIDEMNFLEWFNGKSFKNQLKYVFLFTISVVFQQNTMAQESDSIYPPSPLIEPVEFGPENQLEVDDQTDSIENYALDSNGVVIPIDITEFPELSYKEIIIGIPPPYDPIVFPIDFDIAIVGGFKLEPLEESPNLVPTLIEIPETTISLNNNRYFFGIIADQIRFTSTVESAEKIQLKILDINGNVVFLDNLDFGLGEDTRYFDISKFKNGRYTIIISNGTSAVSNRITYSYNPLI